MLKFAKSVGNCAKNAGFDSYNGALYDRISDIDGMKGIVRPPK